MKKNLLVLSVLTLTLASCNGEDVSSTLSSKEDKSEVEEKYYDVSFLNDDGTLISKISVKEGQKASFDLENPSKDADAKYTYIFDGWDKEFSEISANTTYTAKYIQTLNEYTVTWKNGDDVLKTDSYKYGETPSYTGETPSKDASEKATYTFSGWDPEISEVIGEITYNAIYTETLKEYTVIWEDQYYDTIATEVYKYGETPSFKGNIEDYEDETSIYSFSGWDRPIKPVTADITYHAIFDSEFKTFDVSWLDIDGNLLATESYEYGTTPVYSEEIPSEVTKEDGNYIFEGWSPNIVPVSEDTTYQATYSKASWSNLGADYSKYMTLDVLSTTTDSELSVWTNPSFQVRSADGWQYGTIDCRWRTIVVVDADGKVLYAVRNPENGYGGPSGDGYYRAKEYEEDYASNPAFTILEGYGKWTKEDPSASKKFLVNVPDGGFIITSYNEKTTLCDELTKMISGGDLLTSTNNLNASHPNDLWYDMRIFYNSATNQLVAYKKNA